MSHDNSKKDGSVTGELSPGEGLSQARAWVEASEPQALLAAFLDHGRVTDARDLLHLATVVLPAKQERSEIEEIFGDDPDDDDGDAVPMVTIKDRMEVFARVAASHRDHPIGGWLEPLLGEASWDTYDFAILSTVMACTCGLCCHRYNTHRHLLDVLSVTVRDRLTLLDRLRSDGRLCSSGLLTSDGDNNLSRRLFFPGPAVLAGLTGDKQDGNDDEERTSRRRGRRRIQQEEERFQARKALVGLDRLVLPSDIRRQIDTAIAQVGLGSILFEDWGLGSVMPYGKGTTMLFSGPSGVGKTACAEAMADALSRPILEVSYPSVQSKFIGDCERGIAEAFATASRSGAVLFWDEIDGLIAVRDHMPDHRQWMVSQVTTFLRELERFEGVCILATNRPGALDPAIDRRLGMRITFPRPTEALRRELWRTMLPAELPLAADVDPDRLAMHDLTGGEIKNVVLNAARLAVVRGPGSQVTAVDIDQSLAWERAGSRKAPSGAEPHNPALPASAGTPTMVPSSPSLCINTRPVSQSGRIALALTAMPVPPGLRQEWMGRRFLTRNGSLVQLCAVRRGKEQADTLLLDVLVGGHGCDGLRGDRPGSVYVVNEDLTVPQGDSGDPRVAGMDVVAEVIDD